MGRGGDEVWEEAVDRYSRSRNSNEQLHVATDWVNGGRSTLHRLDLDLLRKKCSSLHVS